MFSTVEDVQYCGGCSLKWRMFSTVVTCLACVWMCSSKFIDFNSVGRLFCIFGSKNDTNFYPCGKPSFSKSQGVYPIFYWLRGKLALEWIADAIYYLLICSKHAIQSLKSISWKLNSLASNSILEKTVKLPRLGTY